MMFCEKCKSIMLPKGNVLVCTKCGYEKPIENRDQYKVTSERKNRKEMIIIDQEVQTLPRVRAECPKCGNMEAEYWLLQTRKADEPETRFYRCTKCKYTWREYQ